jgi:hypothetical protein
MNTPAKKQMMNVSIITIILGLWLMSTREIKGQGGPVTPTEGFVGTKEIMLLWNDFDLQANEAKIWFQEFGVKPDYEGIENQDERLRQGSIGNNLTSNRDSRYVGITAGDFNNNGIETTVIAHHRYDKIELMEAKVTPSGEIHRKNLHRSFHDIHPSDFDNRIARFMIRSGDVDGDKIDEIAVMYVRQFNDNLTMEIFETGNFNSTALIEIDEIPYDSKYETFAFTMDDLDMNGDLELAVAFRSAEDDGIHLQLFDIVASDGMVTDSIALISSAMIDDSFASNSAVTVSVTSGFMRNDTIKDIAVAYGSNSPCPDCPDTWVQPVELRDDPATPEYRTFEMLHLDRNHRTELAISGEGLVNLNIITADLNLDRRDEIILGARPNIVFSVPDTAFVFHPVETFGGYNDEFGFAIDFMKAADVTGDFRHEIIMASNFFSTDDNYNQFLSLEIYRFNDELNPERIVNQTELHKTTTSGNIKERRYYGIAIGDFNGDNFKIGPGKKYMVSDIVQPLVILNAPPTHFDVIDGIPYDLGSCYTGDWRRTCHFWAEYTESTTTDSTISTTVYSDWGISSEISGGGSYLGLGVSGYMKGTYGEKFSNTASSQKIVNVTSTIRAWGDDRIYATITDYELWEYPIYIKNQDKKGSLIAVVPVSAEDTWFSAKERTAYDYTPTHESGNILSYSRWGDSLAMRGDPIVDLSTYTVSNQNTSTFTFETSEIFSNEQVSQYDIGIEVGASVGGWGVEVSGTANYNFGQIQTHSVEIQKDISLTGNLGFYDGGLGEADYSVKPYLYRSKNGALVVDYKVKPVLPVGSGDTDTWWSEHYGKHPDPAFVLPWRLDPEKSLALQNEDKRTLTKSISLSKKELIPGDTVTLLANIHNFSVKYCNDSVNVRFFLGHPDENHLISSIEGIQEFHTPAGIAEQSYKTISFRWKIPDNINNFNRLYGVIDEDDTQTEIHETNNTGWIILSGNGGITTSTSESEVETVKEQKLTLYPNPAKNLVKIRIPDIVDHPTIEIIHLNGMVMKRLESTQIRMIGNIVEMTLKDIPQGIYYISVFDSRYRKSARLVKM